MGGSLKESGYSPNTSSEQGDLHGRCINSNRRCKYLWRWLWQTDKTAHFDISPSVLAKCKSGRMKNEGNRGHRVLHRRKKHTSRLWVQSSRHWRWGLLAWISLRVGSSRVACHTWIDPACQEPKPERMMIMWWSITPAQGPAHHNTC